MTPFDYYLLFLASSLLIFLGYLILPRGVKAQYCGAGRRRYRRQRRGRGRSGAHNAGRQHQPRQGHPEDILEHIYAYSHSFSPQEHLLVGTPSDVDASRDPSCALDTASFWSGSGVSYSGNKVQQQQKQDSPLPHGLNDLLRQPPGLKFTAHGTKCRPRPVWITLHCDNNIGVEAPSPQSTASHDYRNCLTWRAELKPSSSPTATPTRSVQPKLGNLRKVHLTDILGVELGKRTTALRRVQTAKGVNESDCFSLLTKTGTLDLECVRLDDATGVLSGGRSRSEQQRSLSAGEVRTGFITCLAQAMSAHGLHLNGLQTPTGTPSLQSRLHALGGGSPSASQMEDRTLHSGLLSEGRTISTVSF